MIQLTDEQYAEAFDNEMGGSLLAYAVSLDRAYGAGSYLAYAKWAEQEQRLADHPQGCECGDCCRSYGDHDISVSATKCGRCGAELCELCGSDQHTTSEGHDLSNPRYWGV